MNRGETPCCGHTFDPEGWQTDLPDVETDLDTIWVCDREPQTDADVCVFHMSTEQKEEYGVSDEHVVERLQTEINKQGPKAKQFIDATFGEVDLRNEVIDPPDNHPIDFHHSAFEGKLLLENATITNDVTFYGSKFKQLWMNGVQFDRSSNWYGCQFDGTVKADNSRFSEDVLFSRSHFEYGVRFGKSPQFDGSVTFTGATFHSRFKIGGGRFTGRVFFRGVDFQKAKFRRSTFSEQVYFSEATFSGPTDFTDITFDDRVYFGIQDRNEDYDAATFKCEPDFADTTFRSLADFVGTKLSEDISFGHLTCTGILELDPVLLANDSVDVDFKSAEIATGALLQPPDGVAFYDFESAIVGNIDFSRNTHDETALAAVRFIECDFDGFDFASYRRALDPAYSIHEFSELAQDSETEVSSSTREITYQKAKVGAKAVGDNRAASNFFVHEMRSRKAQFATQIDQAETTVERYKYSISYFKNDTFDLISIYGESPARVICVAISAVLAYTWIFWMWYGYSEATLDTSMPVLLDFLLLSLESFTGLVHAGGPAINNGVVRTIAATEGFLGAFFVALFLFTLTRSVYR